MKKMSFVLISITAFTLTLCSTGESPENSFEKFKQAACQGNVEEVLSRMNFKSLAVSMFKEGNPKATETEIQTYVSSPKFNEDILQMNTNFKKVISQKDNDICKSKLIDSKAEGETATLQVQERADNPYLIFKYTFKKSGNKWLWSSVDGLVNPPVNISSSDLYSEYQTNVIAADEKFKGKPIAVKGKINQIGKDIANRVYFTVGKGIMGDVQCFVSSAMVQKVASLKPGDEVDVTGICNGKVMIPELKECVF